MENQKKNNILLTFLAGAAAGAVLGILFAPDRGSNTRKKITDQTMDFTNDLQESGTKILDSLDDLRERVMNIVSDITGGNLVSAGLGALQIRGNWNDIKRKLKREYSNLTDEDLNYSEGMENELVVNLQKKLGKSKDVIIDMINSFQSEKQSQH
ncbi:MAG: YtxH domain-containing protein [Bacteroidota bacterium]|nr:YtxH domain-containing protein [Bacteroidota bacterium]